MQIITIAVRNFLLDFKSNKEIWAEKLLQIIICLGVFLVPLFYYPFFSEKFFEFSKIALFAFLIFLALFFWLIKTYIFSKIYLSSYFLDVPLALFLLIYLLASIFSVDRWQSFIGSNLVAGFSFSVVLLLVIFYFFVSRYIRTLRKIMHIYYFLAASFFLISLSNLINLLPLKIPIILTGLSVSNFSLILLLGFFLSLILILLDARKLSRIVFCFLLFYFFFYLVIVDKPQILLILILAIFFLIFLLSLKSEKFSEKLIVGLTLLLFAGVLMAILPVNNFFGLISVSDLSLPKEYAWEITSATLGDNFLLGAGPQNFIYSFYKYKPVSFNLINFWQLGFLKSYNFWLEILNNIGLLGSIIFLVILIKLYSVFVGSIKRLIILDEFTYKKYLINCSLAIILFILVAFGFFYNYYFITIFLFFLFLGLAASSLESTKIENIFANRKVISLFFYVFFILLICVAYLGSKYILADIYSEKASVIVLENESSFDRSEAYLQRAIKLNNNCSGYYIKLAKLQLNELIFKINRQEALNDTSLWDNIDRNLDLALRNETNRYDNYLEIYRIYAALKQVGIDVLDKQKVVIAKLLELNSNNPELYIDRALLYFDDYLLIKTGKIQSADLENQQAILLQKIKADIEKSIELKPNYGLGYYNLGLYYQEIGDGNKAMENIQKAFDYDPGQQFIAENLKTLYLNQGKAQEAIRVLTKYLEINPADNELRLELAVIYKEVNQLENAREQAVIILEYDPENEGAKEFLQ